MNATTILNDAILDYERNNGRIATIAHVSPNLRIGLEEDLKKETSRDTAWAERSQKRACIEYCGVEVKCDVSLSGTKIWLE